MVGCPAGLNFSLGKSPAGKSKVVRSRAGESILLGEDSSH